MTAAEAMVFEQMLGTPTEVLKDDLLYLYKQDGFGMEYNLLLTLLEDRLGLEEFDKWCLQNHLN